MATVLAGTNSEPFHRRWDLDVIKRRLQRREETALRAFLLLRAKPIVVRNYVPDNTVAVYAIYKSQLMTIML
jgi:hypothetical protein